MTADLQEEFKLLVGMRVERSHWRVMKRAE